MGHKDDHRCALSVTSNLFIYLHKVSLEDMEGVDFLDDRIQMRQIHHQFFLSSPLQNSEKGFTL